MYISETMLFIISYFYVILGEMPRAFIVKTNVKYFGFLPIYKGVSFNMSFLGYINLYHISTAAKPIKK